MGLWTGDYKHKHEIVTSIWENIAWGMGTWRYLAKEMGWFPHTHTHFRALGEWHEWFEQTYVNEFEEFSIPFFFKSIKTSTTTKVGSKT